MDQAAVDLILGRIDAKEEGDKERHQETLRRLGGVEEQARITNGRVTALEADAIRRAATRRFVSKAAAVVVAAVATTATLVNLFT